MSKKQRHTDARFYLDKGIRLSGYYPYGETENTFNIENRLENPDHERKAYVVYDNKIGKKI